jgi:hypothetical protein
VVGSDIFMLACAGWMMLMGGNIVNVRSSSPSYRVPFHGGGRVGWGLVMGLACCWVLREQAPLGERVLLSLGCRALVPVLIPVLAPVPASRLSGWVGCGGWVRLVGCWGGGGLVGVCELDSGCEHLVVMLCGLFVCVVCAW